MHPAAISDRFWSKVERGSADQCWAWMAGRFITGYGSFWLNSGMALAHRVSYELTAGAIPDGMIVMHSCDNRRCVNPAHLLLGTHTDNMRDMVAKGRSRSQRQTHCKNGHEFTPANTYYRPTNGKARPNGTRTCLQCRSAWALRRRQRGQVPA